MQRLRVSSWVNPSDMMILTDSKNEKSSPVMTKDGRGRNAPQLNEALFQRGKGILDDMTLQRTMNNDLALNPFWDPLVLQGSDPNTDQGKAERVAFFQNVVDMCHQNNMQCLLGYTMMNPREPQSKFKSFNDWLKDTPAYKQITPEKYADRVADFLDANVPDCDGISFDIEGLGTGIGISKDMTQAIKDQQIEKREAILKTMIDRYGRFLGALADRLAKSKKVVGVATAGLTSETEATPGYTAEDGFRLHQFTLAKDHPNMIIRPMAYDNVKLEGKDDPATLRNAVQQTLAWHDKIIAYALSVIPAEQFQLGFKTIMARKDDGKPPDYGGFITDVATIRKRCEDVLRPKNIGIIFFPTSAGFWSECNEGINNGAPAAGEALAAALAARQQASKQPVPPNPAQMPLDEDAFYRMNSWRRVPMIPPIDY